MTAADHLEDRDLLNRGVVDASGQRLGDVADVYVDPVTGERRWLVLRSGLLSNRVRFVPASGSQVESNDRLRVAVGRRLVRKAPKLDADGDLTADEEAALRRHYAIAAREPRVRDAIVANDDTLMGIGHDDTVEVLYEDPTDSADEVLTRSEEELDVTTRPEPLRRARLYKEIVTEEVELRVPVRREVLRVEYLDVDDSDMETAASSDDFPAFDAEPIVLFHEVVEVTKRVVPKERVRLVKEIVPEVVDVRGYLRKEQVDVRDVEANVEADTTLVS